MKSGIDNCFTIVLTLFLLSACNTDREYTEYNYSELNQEFGGVFLEATMIGKYEDIEGSKRKTVRRNPYYLRISLQDPGAEFASAELVSVQISGAKSGTPIELSALPEKKLFSESVHFDHMHAGLSIQNIRLDMEDYEVNLEMELCDAIDCDIYEMSGRFELQTDAYESNDIVDKYLSQ